MTRSTWTKDLGERARARREELHLSVEFVADRIGVSPDTLVQLETTGTLTGMGTMVLTDLAELLQLGFLLPTPEPASLGVLARAWQWNKAHMQALSMVHSWVERDHRLTQYALPDDSIKDTSLMGRGCPEASTPAFSPMNPAPVVPLAFQEDLNFHLRFARQAGFFLREHYQVSPLEKISADTWASLVGAHVGYAPLEESVRGVIVNVDGAIVIVLNSSHHASVNETSLGHLVTHAILGDVVLGLVDHVPDQDDDSIVSCYGAPADRCMLASWVARALQDMPALLAMEEQRKWWDEMYDKGIDTFSPTRRVRPVPDPRGPGHWEDEDSSTWVQPLRRLLGVYHDDLMLPPGSGMTVWPRSLVERQLKVVARGLLSPHEAQEWGLTGLHADLMERARVAAAQYQLVQDQLHR